MELNTIERFLLIAQHPSKGRYRISEVFVKYGTIGAILLEMTLSNKIKVENNILLIEEDAEFQNPVLNEIAFIIKSSTKPRKIKYWIRKLSSKSNKFRWAFANDLAIKRLIRIENKKFLGFIPYRLCYLEEPRISQALIENAKQSILSNEEIAVENMMILGLIEACKMHKIITSDKLELKTIKKELKQIIKENPIASTVESTIREVQAAIMAAIIVSTVATTSSSSH